MGAKISCYTCEHYRPTRNLETGLCTLLDDLAGPTYAVDSSSKECLYNFTTLPRVLTNSETKLRDEEAETKRRVDLYEHCISLTKRTTS